MEKTLQLINQAQSESVFSSYAIGGGIAALFYIEPVATFDLDIFIIIPETPGKLVSLSAIYSWYEKRGCKPGKEQIIIEGVAVQFIPVYNDLVKDSVLNAIEKNYGKTSARVLRPEYLVAIMLQTFRPRDKERIIRFMQEVSLDNSLLDSILYKHNLKQVFESFKKDFYGGKS